MDKIEMFVENLFKRSPKTLEVDNQKIEILADLREKISIEVNKGKSFDDAFEFATASYRDIGELSAALDKTVRSIYINRFSCHVAWLSAGISIFLMFISLTVFLKMNPDIYADIVRLVADPFSNPDYIGGIIGGVVGILGALTGISAYPIKTTFAFFKEPGAVQKVGFDLKTRLIRPFFCWLLISAILTASNLYLYYHFEFELLIYPLFAIIIASWPIDALLFRIMYRLRKYEANEQA